MRFPISLVLMRTETGIVSNDVMLASRAATFFFSNEQTLALLYKDIVTTIEGATNNLAI